LVSVALEFIPPDEPDLFALHVYEAATVNGPFTEIDVTQSIGSFPNYITRYTTQSALAVTDWFAIAWENLTHVVGELSAAMQGGTSTLVSEVVNRVMLRDPSLNQIIVSQEAEIAVAEIFGTNDPVSLDPDEATLQQMSGLTYYTMARSYISSIVTTSRTAGGKWVAGLVSLDTSSASKSTSPWDTIEYMLRVANRELGKSYSMKLLLAEIEVAGGFKKIVAADLSRTIIEVA
jgi:hypothetical protein